MSFSLFLSNFFVFLPFSPTRRVLRAADELRLERHGPLGDRHLLHRHHLHHLGHQCECVVVLCMCASVCVVAVCCCLCCIAWYFVDLKLLLNPASRFGLSSFLCGVVLLHVHTISIIYFLSRFEIKQLHQFILRVLNVSHTHTEQTTHYPHNRTQVMAPKTQLIAHDKEVYDIAFACGKDIFGTVGADGSLRMFDLR